MRRTSINWSPNEHDAVSVANSRVCLAFLRIFRDVPVEIDRHSLDRVTKPMWPAIRLERGPFQRWLKAQSKVVNLFDGRRKKSLGSAVDSLDDDVPQWLRELTAPSSKLPSDAPDDEALYLLGSALLRDVSECRALYDAVEQRLARCAARVLPIDRNIGWLAELLGLNLVERGLLTLCAAMEASTLEHDVLSYITSFARRVRALRIALQLPDEHDVSVAVDRRGTLQRSGLLVADERADNDLDDLFRLSRLGSLLTTSVFASVDEMATRVLKPLPEADSTLAWPHLQSRTVLLQRVLGTAMGCGDVGINVLLYGPPGTGKTQYARQLAAQAGAQAFGIDDMNEQQRAASRDERLGSLRLNEVFAPAEHSVLVLDEAEDIFQTDYASPLRRLAGPPDDSKSWMNQLLEGNRVPVIWISNQIDHIDPAYLRRFTYCLEFPVPPRELRREIARGHLSPVGGSEQLIDAIAAHATLPAALVASAARFVTLSGAAPECVDAAAQQMLTDHLRAMGQPFRKAVVDGTTRFDLDYLNVQGSAQPSPMLKSLSRLGRGTILLAGPPGTGKTQLAAQIARQLDRELVYRTAADINSKWYGESERNVASLFTDCDPVGEVLFLDEAETLLGDRSSTGQRADRAVTAEFLRRVEAFEGIFVCATNHVADFDPALMRRFVFRLQLLPLTAQQRERLLGECMANLNVNGNRELVTALNASQLARLQRLDQLTPGDFSNVAKRFRALDVQADAGAWLDELEEEHQAKPGSARGAMGFM